MSTSTNPLVARFKGYIAPTAIATSVALGGILMFNHKVHATPVSALDDHSVAALMSLDNAMETVAQRVTPSVVNIAVTSKGNPEEASEGGQDQGQGMQQLPPEFRRFFGQGGQGGMRMQPQQPQIEHGIGSGVIISPDGYIARTPMSWTARRKFGLRFTTGAS